MKNDDADDTTERTSNARVRETGPSSSDTRYITEEATFKG